MRARPQVHFVEGVRVADVEGLRPARPLVEALLHGDRVEAFRSLFVAFLLLGSERAGPVADRVGGEELVVALLVAGPDLHFGFGLEHADEHRGVLGDALLGKALVEALQIRRARERQLAVRVRLLALHAQVGDVLNVQRMCRRGPDLSQDDGSGAHGECGTPYVSDRFLHAVASAHRVPTAVWP